MSAAKDATRRFLAGILMLPAALFSVYVAPNFGAYEGRIFPVGINYKVINKIATPNGEFDIVVSFTKIRSCQLKDITTAIEITDGVWQEFNQSYPEGDDYKSHSRPLGNWISRWHMIAPISLIDKPMRITVFHQCWGLLLWQTETLGIDEAHPAEIVIKKEVAP